MRGLRALLLAGTCALSACSTAPTRPQPAPNAPISWVERRDALSQWTRFEAAGRLSSAELGVRADFRWTQIDADHFELRLFGPFGAGAIQMRGSAAGVEVSSKEGTQFTPDPEAWLQQRMGWSLPVHALRYWILGLPLPSDTAQLQFDASGRVLQLDQDGWTLVYADYQNSGLPAADFDLPRRFDASNDRVRLRMLVDSWSREAP